MADKKLNDTTIAVLATNGVEQSELEKPVATLEQHGATIHVIAPEEGSIKGWSNGNWGDEVTVHRTIADAIPRATSTTRCSSPVAS